MSEEIINDNQEKDNKKNNWRPIISWVLTIFICLGLAKLFTTFVVRSVEVDGYSMASTLSDGDKALTDAIFYNMYGIDRFDIVIVKRKSGTFANQELVKRVIALPGETIEYKNGVLYINDTIVEEPFIDSVVASLTGTISKRTLGENEYFVMGDNRGNSTDSRYFGSIKKNEIKGRGILRFMVCVAKDSDNECSKRKFVWPSSVK